MLRFLLIAVLLLTSCSLNPALRQPQASVPSVFPERQAFDTTNAASRGWQTMFRDPRLRRLLDLALSQSRDLRVAMLNAEAAEAQSRIQRGALFPSLNGTGSYTRTYIPASVAGAGVGISPDQEGMFGSSSGIEFGQFAAQAALASFELDLFGRLHSQSQSAFEQYLASAAGQKTARITLVSTVAMAYFTECLAKEQLELTRATLDAWNRTLELTKLLHLAAQLGGSDVEQAEAQARQITADLEEGQRVLARANNALILAVGGSLPADLPPPTALMVQPVQTQLPAGLPSDLLTRRPDIEQAEHDLLASNADVGAARAAFFPSISLTAALGLTSLDLNKLFNADSRNWSISPQISTPIFQGGQLKGSLDLAKIRKSLAVAKYERTIQRAFREVSDNLAGRATFDRQQAAQQEAALSADKRLMLSRARHLAGVEGRLELLDAQRTAYAAHKALLDVRYASLANAVNLYRSLGGGLGKDDESVEVRK